ncbi:MAG: hypothetical protein ACOX25_11535 [Caldicoprobacterales bacterium]|jgi:hypothetical protein|nr:hypothetical protein [Clostridiales bacterium]
MKWMISVLAAIFNRLSFSLPDYHGYFYQAGWAISFGLYYQFENLVNSDAVFLRFVSMSTLDRALSLLSSIGNSAVQSLEILFLFSSMLLIMHHTLKVLNNLSMKLS